jgi:hypothetical protein
MTFAMSLGLASELNGHLAIQNRFAIELGNGAFSLRRSGEVNKGIANRTGGARVGRNGSGFNKVILEELLQLPLSSRISEVPNVESPTLGSTGSAGVNLLSRGGFLAGVWCRLVVVVEGGGCHLGGDAVDSSGGHDCWKVFEIEDTRLQINKKLSRKDSRHS